MAELMLFTDSSLHPPSRIGYGAYLLVPHAGLGLEDLKKQVQLMRFEQTSSTKLELETLLWALSDIRLAGKKLTIYSDSQNIIDLPARRARLEQMDYRSNNNRRLNNYLLYQQFYRLTEQLDCRLLKVRGHLPTQAKTAIDQLFTLVDRAARKSLRDEFR